MRASLTTSDSGCGLRRDPVVHTQQLQGNFAIEADMARRINIAERSATNGIHEAQTRPPCAWSNRFELLRDAETSAWLALAS